MYTYYLIYVVWISSSCITIQYMLYRAYELYLGVTEYIISWVFFSIMKYLLSLYLCPKNLIQLNHNSIYAIQMLHVLKILASCTKMQYIPKHIIHLKHNEIYILCIVPSWTAMQNISYLFHPVLPQCNIYCNNPGPSDSCLPLLCNSIFRGRDNKITWKKVKKISNNLFSSWKS